MMKMSRLAIVPMLVLGVFAGGLQGNVAHAAAKHCVKDAATKAQTCYGSFREAISAASGGRVTTDPSDPAYNVQRRAYSSDVSIAADPTFSGNAVTLPNDGRVVLGVAFDGGNFTGGTVTMVGPRLCDARSHTGGFPDLLFSGDFTGFPIGSLQPWGRCWLWIGPNFFYSTDGPFKSDTPDLGGLTDRYGYVNPGPWG